jgi:hypothetical protein
MLTIDKVDHLAIKWYVLTYQYEASHVKRLSSDLALFPYGARKKYVI